MVVEIHLQVNTPTVFRGNLTPEVKQLVQVPTMEAEAAQPSGKYRMELQCIPAEVLAVVTVEAANLP